MDKAEISLNQKVQLYFANLQYLKEAILEVESGNSKQRDARYTFNKAIELNPSSVNKEKYTKKMSAWCTRHNISLSEGGLGKLISEQTHSPTMPQTSSPGEAWIIAQARISWMINYNTSPQ